MTCTQHQQQQKRAQVAHNRLKAYLIGDAYHARDKDNQAPCDDVARHHVDGLVVGSISVDGSDDDEEEGHGEGGYELRGVRGEWG